MKTLTRLLFILACTGFIFGCQKSDDEIDDQPISQLKNSQPVAVIVPFKANLSVWDKSDYTDTRCGGFPLFFLTMEGSGTSTHLGNLTTRFTFCCNVMTGEYSNTEAVFIAANGDELYARIPLGYIVPNEGDNSAYYQTIFNDPMTFTGGTGRFEGASGEAMTNAFVHDGTDEWRTDFFPEGNLILVKEKH